MPHRGQTHADRSTRIHVIIKQIANFSRLIRDRNPDLVEAALVHRVGLAHEDVGRDLVLGATELAESREPNQIVEGLLRQRQAQRPRLGTVFRSGHLSHAPWTPSLRDSSALL